ncbi:MAG: hypothetical protein GF334_12595 [Candidatus Altiarchaeales archaeon]|nr:hypothetical protein [Candidatus Altiarchaeales archaeon]
MRVSTLAGICACMFILGCLRTPQINSFEECVAASNPVMESYPRQCTADGKTFTEKLKSEAEFIECASKPQACTKEYDPVCAIIDNGIRCTTRPCPSTNAIDYGNACVACSKGAYGYYRKACSDNLFIVCQETTTGIDPIEYAKDAGGICVKVCPGNYDPYTTQTGIKLCTRHYGEEAISGWSVCERSTEDCNCVKAYETTKGEEIHYPSYRCVPKRYANRLLFRGGVDRLDRNGEQSTLIA